VIEDLDRADFESLRDLGFGVAEPAAPGAAGTDGRMPPPPAESAAAQEPSSAE
jgi:hypothetical protein